MLGMGKIVLSVIVGILLLSPLGLMEADAGLRVKQKLADFEDWVGPLHEVESDSTNPSDSVFVTDSSFYGGGVGILSQWFGGPGPSKATLSPGGPGLVWDQTAGTEGGLDFFFSGGPPLELFGDDLMVVRVVEYKFPLVIVWVMEDDNGNISESPPMVFPSPGGTFPQTLPVLVSELKKQGAVDTDFGRIMKVTVKVIGISQSIVTIASISIEEEEILVGGTLIPIDTTALLVAGFNANSIWMIPAVLGMVGAGIVIFKLKRK